MQYTTRHLLFATLLFALFCGFVLLIYSVVNSDGDDAHYYGVGIKYEIESYSFLLDGAQFDLTKAELDSLESEWKLYCFENVSGIRDQIENEGFKLKFRCRLSDGYRIESDCIFAEIGRKQYLQLRLVTSDGGGFQADFSYLRINLGNVLSGDRLREVRLFIAQTEHASGKQ